MRLVKCWLLQAGVLLTLLSASVIAYGKVVPLSQASELKNRFRIDHMVDELTLFIQREYGSAPVILVLPDGSKWYQSRHPESVKWVDGLSGDMVTISSPMPGPWQLLGQIVPGSKISKVSKLAIDLDPLPQPLYQSERLKITARLMGDEQRVRMPGLDYLIDWSVKFISQHRADEENFAAGSFNVGSYKDNGQGLDERPDDGIFTADINLHQPWGHYRLQVIADNLIFSREIDLDFELKPLPIEVELLEPDNPQSGVWQLRLKVDESELNLADTHFDFELLGPAGVQQALPLGALSAGESLINLPNVSELGSYRIKGSAVSTTTSGREVVLTLPEQFFSLSPPPPPPPTKKQLAELAAKKAAQDEAQAKDKALLLIMVINGALLLLGGLGLFLWRKRQKWIQSRSAKVQNASQLGQKRMQEVSASLDEIDLIMPKDFTQSARRD
ncbi:TIGR03503 family protein [Shewanella sp. AS1]|uniref:TIGR03503 family protein n=1 Tax=Shewanella sp. AS1 TaxID=2907626 RepID=UPI001F475C60|nr:TIGR03503 family protein [Shewanella sp. AS1]MCE9678809.1 TIGR03503 family protein [Shewanella sp. AS1]